MNPKWIEVRTRSGQTREFKTPKAFHEWVKAETSVWQSITDISPSGYDNYAWIGQAGCSEHSNEWAGVLQRLQAAQAETDPDVILTSSQAQASALSDRLLEGGMIELSSGLGTRIVGLATSDAAAAKLIVALTTGRTLTQLTHRQNLSLWRMVPRMLALWSNESLKKSASEVEAASVAATGFAAEAAASSAAIDQLLSSARDELSAEAIGRAAEQKQVIDEAQERLEGQLANADRQWKERIETYDVKIALQQPVTYWQARADAHQRAYKFWGLISVVVALAAAAILPAGGYWLLQQARTQMPDTEGEPTTFADFAPELFCIAVVAFLFLWLLRFCVRRVSESIFKADDASQRCTMVSAFLALKDPKEGRQPVINEADTAIIVQALFRPHGSHDNDDGPPSHWIEDLYARVKGKDKA